MRGGVAPGVGSGEYRDLSGMFAYRDDEGFRQLELEGATTFLRTGLSEAAV